MLFLSRIYGNFYHIVCTVGIVEPAVHGFAIFSDGGQF